MAACATTSAAAPSNARIMVSSSGTPSVIDPAGTPGQSLITFGNAMPKVRMQMASLKMKNAFCLGFMSRYGVPVDCCGFDSMRCSYRSGHCTRANLQQACAKARVRLLCRSGACSDSRGSREKGRLRCRRPASLPWSPRSREFRFLRRYVAVDILVDAACVRTAVATPALGRVAFAVRRRQDDTALDDIGREGILVLRHL